VHLLALSASSSSKHAASEALSRCCILLAWALSMLRGACLRPLCAPLTPQAASDAPWTDSLEQSLAGDPMVLLLARLPSCTRSDLIDALGMFLVPRGGAVALCSSPTYVACPARSARSSARSPPTRALLYALLRRSAFSSQLALIVAVCA
jgi:hypothetical protein